MIAPRRAVASVVFLYGAAVPFRIGPLAAMAMVLVNACRPDVPADAVHHPQSRYVARDVEPSAYVQLGERPLGKDEADVILGRTVDTASIGALDLYLAEDQRTVSL